jgi:hypothetical protein
MQTTPPLKTQKRYALLAFAIIAQLLLLAILIPATRSEALSFLWLLLGTLLNSVIGFFLCLKIIRDRTALAGGCLYFLLAIFLAFIEMLVLRLNQPKGELLKIHMGLFFPAILVIANASMQQKKQPTQQPEPEPREREKLRNRNGV